MPKRFQTTRPQLLALLLFPLLLPLPGRADPSMVTGRKYLLSVGINQYPEKPLRGCVNDATGIQETLVDQFGFDRRDTTLLTDFRATRAGILTSIQRYLGQVGQGDLFVFFYSGHGALYPDSDSLIPDEPDDLDLSALRLMGVNLQDGRYDSTLVPIDAHVETRDRPWGNMILDDELHALFSQMTSRGAFVLLLSDSCHSGTLARSISLEERHKFIDPQAVLGRRLPPPLRSGAGRLQPKASFGGRLLAIAASQDNQLSIDGLIQNRFQGRFTASLQRAIAKLGPSASYQQVFAEVRSDVDRTSGGAQTPSLDRRYFDGPLEVAIFSLPFVPTSTTSKLVQVRFILRSRSGQTIPRGSIALFPIGQRALPAKITPANTLAVVTTRENGEALSVPLELTGGQYLVKALADGFEVFSGLVRIEDPSGQPTLLLVLDPQ
jgi:hypothetical protein